MLTKLYGLYKMLIHLRTDLRKLLERMRHTNWSGFLLPTEINQIFHAIDNLRYLYLTTKENTITKNAKRKARQKNTEQIYSFVKTT